MDDENEFSAATPATERQGISQEDLVKALAQIPAEQLTALLAAGVAPQSGTPKFSPALKSVKPSERSAVIDACAEGLRISAEKPNDPEAQIAPLRRVSPALAHAALANSTYRRKPIAHSLRVVITFFQSRTGS